MIFLAIAKITVLIYQNLPCYKCCLLDTESKFLSSQIFENQVLQNSDRRDPRTMTLVWDTVASYGLTLFRSDFIDYVKCDIVVKDVTNVNRVIGIGNTLHKFIESNVQDILFPCMDFLP